MKTIILEGTDRVGKSTLITGISEYHNYDNIIVRHCGKPPKHINKEDVYQWQMRCFIKEAVLADILKNMEIGEHRYYENVVIYNRYYLGEYVYGIMFREYREEFIEHRLSEFESQHIDLDNTKLITLVADPEFLMSKEDGNSFSQTLEQKTKEVELFKIIHNKSLIKNKLLLKVDNDGEFLPKEQLLNTVLDFINGKK